MRVRLQLQASALSDYESDWTVVDAMGDSLSEEGSWTDLGAMAEDDQPREASGGSTTGSSKILCCDILEILGSHPDDLRLALGSTAPAVPESLAA